MAPPFQAQAIAGSDVTGDTPARKTGPTVPPRNPYEEAVVAIWSDLLGRSDFGVHDDFFGLGGHSLLAPKVVARIRKTLGVAIPVKDFFESPTAAGLAATVAAQAAAEPRVVTPRPPDAAPVLSFDQQRLWLENQLLPGAAYNIHGRRRLTGPVDVPALEASIRAILLRHEALRTRFPTVDGTAVQVVDDLEDTWRLRVEDVVGETDPSDAARRLADEQASTPFDLATGPLFRCMLIRLDDTTHILAVTMHHIVSDAWSIGLFVRELLALYEAGGDVEQAGLPPLPVQYRDYAVWQRDYLAGETIDREVNYWRRHLDGAPTALNLPAAHRQAVARQSGGRVHAALSASETAALHVLCRKHGVSPFMALLAALSTVLSRWSGQRDIVVGVPIAGRSDAGTDLLVGFFVNTLPIRVDLTGDLTFAGLLQRVRQVCLDGYAHAEAPVDVVVEQLQVVRDPRRTPLFEVILNVIGSPEVEQVNGVSIEPMEAPTLPSKFDLVCNAQENDGILRLHLDFNADRFDAPMMQVLLSHVQSLLRATAADPAKALVDYRLEPFAGEPVPAPAPLAAHRPAPPAGRIAVVDAAGEWTYEWVGRAADLIAGRLPEAATVGVVRRPVAGFVAAVLGCVRAGLPYSVIEADSEVPLHYLGVSAVLDVEDGSIDLSELPSTGSGDVPVVGDWAQHRYGFAADDRIAPLCPRPGLLVSAITSALASGATLYLPSASVGGDSDAWLHAHGITVAYLSPAQLRALRGPLPALRQVIVDNSGDVISHDVDLVRRAAPGCRFVGVYRVGRDGRPLAVHEVPEDWQLSTAPLRVPLGVELSEEPAELLHPIGQAAAVGEVAELRFGDYRTGDLARRWHDGTLEFVGRLGANLSFDPLETLAALRDVPDVVDAVVTELVDAEDRVVLVGYVTGVAPEQAAGIRRGLVLRLPEHLIPRHLFVVDTLDRAPDGDYDLATLPEPDGDETADSYVAPRTPLERRLGEIFEELLEVERVGIYDTFFELNGFSLLATTLTARIRDEFNVELSLREIFGAPTVESLALLILSRQSELSDDEELEAILNEIGGGH
ncbi:hypothetical protein CA850_23230 [Micromonospora echinospora]|uniref:Non-ribosomal peptide synthetase component F n=1 Tax=Micromonospora echinospora TaxID=1877 RepID=A0A1C4YS71_MICEC|nr:condensation domain-containing protein [Micromonospora echinospora]OZV77370.1 hypothetical protein CA850_23230 [Micromonospora echinospora]SCF23599.1 Non-ribosomal peptide synthetase component F [Micromonospora echinospora]